MYADISFLRVFSVVPVGSGHTEQVDLEDMQDVTIFERGENAALEL